MFLMWLGEQITARGIGNGISLIIFAGIVAELAERHCRHARTWPHRRAVDRRSSLRSSSWPSCVIAFIVFFERAQRRLLIQYPKRQVGNRMFQGDTSHLPLKLNTVGRHPADLRLVAAAAAGHACRLRRQQRSMPDWATHRSLAALGHGQPLYMAALRGADRLLPFFYTAIVFNPKDTADNLKKHGGFIPGHPSGRAHGRIHRLCADAHHRHRRALPGLRLPPARIPDSARPACRSISAARRC